MFNLNMLKLWNVAPKTSVLKLPPLVFQLWGLKTILIQIHLNKWPKSLAGNIKTHIMHEGGKNNGTLKLCILSVSYLKCKHFLKLLGKTLGSNLSSLPGIFSFSMFQSTHKSPLIYGSVIPFLNIISWWSLLILLRGHGFPFWGVWNMWKFVKRD